MSNKGQTLESWIHYVYDMLLNLRNDGVSVQRDVKLVGRSKVLHQIDVYYEFSRAGLKHRVAIECKDHNRPITKGDIQEFHGKLFDIGNILGIIVSQNGFQSGAREFAQFYGIEAICPTELPNLFELVVLRTQSLCVPAKDAIGQPFWTLIYKDREDLFSTYSCFYYDPEPDIKLIPLFVSKTLAESCRRCRPHADQLEVRGLEQHVLSTLIKMLAEVFPKAKVKFAYIYDEAESGPGLVTRVKAASEIGKQFVWS